MQILLSSHGTAGDVHPFVGLGRRLIARGHRVTMMADPYFERLIGGAGIEFLQVLPSAAYDEVRNHPDAWHPIKSLLMTVDKIIVPLLKSGFEAVRDRYVPGETLLVAHPLDFGTRMARDKLGGPLVTIQLTPVVFRSVYAPPVIGPFRHPDWQPKVVTRFRYSIADKLADHKLGRPLNAARKQLGMAPVKRVMRDWWNSPDRVVAMFPEWYAPPQPDWPPQTVLTGFPMYDESDVTEVSAELEQFLSAGGPPIVFGTASGNKQAAAFFREAAETCRRLQRRGILLTRHTEQIPAELPDGVRHFDFVPHSKVLPRAAAIVHHAGIGTIAQALAAGIPQVATPMAYDQFDNAERLKRMGVAAELRPNKFQAARAADALKCLLESETVRERCAHFAEQMRDRDPIGRACDEIEAVGCQPGPAGDAL